MFVGRITRQKGLPYLLRAAARLPPEVQLVLCAGAPDTPEIAGRGPAASSSVCASRAAASSGSRRCCRAPDLIAVLAACTVFVCPCVYEPLGIVNLEAMAVGLPVVGTATGGIPEVVDDGVTGLLVPIEQADDGTGTPLDPDRFVADLAAALTDGGRPTRSAPRDGRGRRAAGRGPLRLGRDRRAHARRLPAGAAQA